MNSLGVSQDVPYLVDTHAHLDLSPLSGDLSGVLARAADAGVRQVITIGTDVASSLHAAELAGLYANVHAAVGIHPHDAASVTDDDIWACASLLARSKIVAVGEIGLDFVKEYAPRGDQQRVFRAMLALAMERKLPVVIHDREAHDDVIRSLRLEGKGQLSGVFHCFSGDVPFAKAVLGLGFHISITGVVTFPKAGELRDVVRFVPLDRLLLETDCPYLSPVPFRGRPNEPARVVTIAEAVANIKGVSMEEVAVCTSRNARGLFGLPRP